jgi:hypothetical protein
MSFCSTCACPTSWIRIIESCAPKEIVATGFQPVGAASWKLAATLTAQAGK